MGLHNFTSRPTSRLLSLPHLPRPTPLLFSPYAAGAHPCVPGAVRLSVAYCQPLGRSKPVSSAPAIDPVCALLTDLNWAGSLGDPPSNTCRRLLAASLRESQELGRI
jgi:hypothetical protein